MEYINIYGIGYIKYNNMEYLFFDVGSEFLLCGSVKEVFHIIILYISYSIYLVQKSIYIHIFTYIHMHTHIYIDIHIYIK